MKINGLIVSIVIGSIGVTLRGQDAAPPSVDLYSGQKQPEAAAAPPEPNGPDLPALSQLDEGFKQKPLGKKADELRLHAEWRQLKNRVVNDPAVRAAEAATHTAHTDLEKRKRLREYYKVYYQRMSALASTPDMKAALEALKSLHIGATTQPRTRHATDAALPGAGNATVAALQSAIQSGGGHGRGSVSGDQRKGLPDLSMATALNLINQTTPQPPGPTDDILGSAEKTGQLSTFLKYLNLIGKADVLRRNGPYTLFAPSDKACAEATAKGSGPLAGLNNLSSPAQMVQAGWKRLSYYVVNGALTSDKLNTMSAPTLNGASLDIKVINGQITVNDAHVIKGDVKASNGVIHIIDKMLTPPTT